MTAINLFPCANLGCNEDSRYSCSKCKLISVSLNPSIPSDHGLRGMKYCDKCCQVAHWPEHKAICKSPLMSDNWLPCSETESRRPAMARTIHHNPFGQGIYPWGNVPAIDVLNLAQNEGNDLCPDIAILFAGWVYLLSFQLRGLWLTILSIWWFAQLGQNHIRASWALHETDWSNSEWSRVLRRCKKRDITSFQPYSAWSHRNTPRQFHPCWSFDSPLVFRFFAKWHSSPVSITCKTSFHRCLWTNFCQGRWGNCGEELEFFSPQKLASCPQ